MRARKVLDGTLEARDRNKIQHFTILFIRFLQRQQLNALQLLNVMRIGKRTNEMTLFSLQIIGKSDKRKSLIKDDKLPVKIFRFTATLSNDETERNTEGKFYVLSSKGITIPV